MAYSLILRMKAPLMSFGYESSGNTIHTDTMPRKSHIVGMLSAALGRQRGEDNSDLCSLKVSVRANNPHPKMIVDLQTTMNVCSAERPNSKETEIRDIALLCDADYTVALEGDLELLEILEKALFDPLFEVFFGRKAHIPSRPLCEHAYGQNIVPLDALTALKIIAFDAHDRFGNNRHCPIRYEVDYSNSRAPIIRDVPIGRTHGIPGFLPRKIMIDYVLFEAQKNQKPYYERPTGKKNVRKYVPVQS